MSTFCFLLVANNPPSFHTLPAEEKESRHCLLLPTPRSLLVRANVLVFFFGVGWGEGGGEGEGGVVRRFGRGRKKWRTAKLQRKRALSIQHAQYTCSDAHSTRCTMPCMLLTRHDIYQRKRALPIQHTQCTCADAHSTRFTMPCTL